MSSLLYTSFAQPLRLGAPLGTGGEGTVYELPDAPALVAKRYHEPLAPARAEKLTLLVGLGNERLSKLTAWPVDVLRAQPGGPIVGFTMKRIGQAEEVHALHSPKSRLQKFPDASWAFLLYVAANIARAVGVVHEHGLIVGDLNPKNILVTRQATVCLLDCDSFQLTATGRTFRCDHGFPEYTPPELQGVTFRDVDRTATHDAFGLAVVIFQLLFLGRHPFSGKFLGADEVPLECAIREGRFAYGSDAATRQMQAPPGTLALEAVSEPVAALFRRAFLGATNRPQPREWVEALETLAQQLTRCAAHSGHQYPRALAACPWCAIEQQARTRLFNFALNGKPTTQSHFPLTEIWREIESVPAPKTRQLPVRQALALMPSTEAQLVAEQQRQSYWLALLFTLLGGWGIAMTLKLSTALIFLIVVEEIARRIAGAAPTAKGVTKAFITGKPPTDTPSPLAQPFAQTRDDAEAAHRELSERWAQETNTEPFHQKLHELRTWKSAYENMDAARAQQLRQTPLPPHRRVKLEREFEAARLQLERDLRNGAAQLQQMRDEIQASQDRLHEPLLAAQKTLAQAERDYGAVAQRNPRAPLIVLLVLSFLLSEWWTAAHLLPTTSPKSNESAQTQRERDLAEALRFYNQGTSLLNAQQFTAAIESYQRAIELDPELAGAYQEMGEAFYRLHDYTNAISASQSALRIAKTFQAYNNLGLANLALGNLRDAKDAFQAAIQGWHGYQNEDGWQARYHWAWCVFALGEANSEMQRLQRAVAIKPVSNDHGFVDDRDLLEQQESKFDLAVFYQLTGRRAAAQRLLKSLGAENKQAADALRQILNSQK